MARIQRPRTYCATTVRNSGSCAVLLLILSISIQSFVFSAAASVVQSNANGNAANESVAVGQQEQSSTTLVYSMTNDGSSGRAADGLEETTNQPEEIIFITSTKKVEKDGQQQRQLKPVYYGTPSGERERDKGTVHPSINGVISDWRIIR